MRDWELLRGRGRLVILWHLSWRVRGETRGRVGRWGRGRMRGKGRWGKGRWGKGRRVRRKLSARVVGGRG